MSINMSGNIDFGDFIGPIIEIVLFIIGTGIILKLFSVIIKKTKQIRVKIIPANYNFAISLEFDNNLNSGTYFQEIKQNIITKLDELQISNQIKLNDISETLQFKNKDDAEKFLIKKNLDLIVWGNFSKDNLKINNQNINQIRLHFTYQLPKNKLEQATFDFSSKLAQKNYWQIFEQNSFSDIKIVSNNLCDLSLYIIAITLMLSGKVEKSKNILEPLYIDLTKRKDIFFEQVKDPLIFIYFILSYNLIISHKNYDKAAEYCQKILNIQPNHFTGITNLALCQTKLGQIEKARENVELLQKYYPYNPLTEVDVAFIYIIGEKYKKAYQHYEKLIKFKLDKLNFNPIETIDFLSEYSEQNKEPAILYAIGIISFYFGDKDLSKIELENFIKKANKNLYKEMYYRAQKILKRINYIESKKSPKIGD